jgi:chromate transporter
VTSGGLPAVPFAEAVRAWVRVALASFGGPAGQIAVIHRVVVDDKRWLGEERFLHALSYCMLLPGPEAQQLATYTGWLLHGTRGGLVAGGLFIVPGFLAILGLSVLYALYREVGVVEAVFFGLKPAVAAIVVEAVVRLRRRALRGPFPAAVAALAFVAILVFEVPFPLIVLGAAVAGLLHGRSRPAAVPGDPGGEAAPPAFPRVGRTLRVLAVWLVLWLGPVLALLAALGAGHVLAVEAVFFSNVAVVTFGGAYAVLAFVAQQAVERFGWLSPGEMLDGLGLAETTPGPLIMVVQFVGFLAAFRDPGGLAPLAAGIAGALVTTWVTFTPSFLFVLAGAPYIEALRGNRALNAALGGITAAVVGVVLNLAVWFALHVLFADVRSLDFGPGRLLLPSVHTLDLAAGVIMGAAMVAVFRFRAGMFAVLGGAAAVGIVMRLVGGR